MPKTTVSAQSRAVVSTAAIQQPARPAGKTTAASFTASTTAVPARLADSKAFPVSDPANGKFVFGPIDPHIGWELTGLGYDPLGVVDGLQAKYQVYGVREITNDDNVEYAQDLVWEGTASATGQTPPAASAIVPAAAQWMGSFTTAKDYSLGGATVQNRPDARSSVKGDGEGFCGYVVIVQCVNVAQAAAELRTF